MLSRKVYVSQFGMNMKLMSLRLVLIALVLALGSLWSDAHAATAANAYVTVSYSTYGVEDIVPIGADFHITTRNVSKPSFRADIIQKGLTLLYHGGRGSDGDMRNRVAFFDARLSIGSSGTISEEEKRLRA